MRVARWRGNTLVLETTWAKNGAVTVKREEILLSVDGGEPDAVEARGKEMVFVYKTN